MSWEVPKPNDRDAGGNDSCKPIGEVLSPAVKSSINSLPFSPDPESVQRNISSLVDSITQELVRSSPQSSGGSEYLLRVPLVERDGGGRTILEDIRKRSSDEYRLQIPPRDTGPPIAHGSTSSPVSPPVTSSAGDDPLPQVLHALDGEEDERIVVVRRITKLGFKSSRIIKTKFQEFGWVVKNVVLLPSRSRLFSQGNAPPNITLGHSRPSSMGFVVLASEKSAKECLAVGSIDIEGVNVLIQPFVREYRPSRNE